MAAKAVRCTRCGRRARKQIEAWNVETRSGRIVAVICPTCQTPEDNAEAEINEATIEYIGVTPDGRIYGRPKAVL
ncbi:hypothetical protein [Gordonia humi]|uniref:Endogenous inhibitor of DNA gyrase (YacG/DUF329 family) n=1 Tax=Gordonia humi TaxID=686429 RepID=A0A840F0B7_9ACTN|nr:hypothetical protein [Gordonia humi]MBB4134729.1 endogenous inhibitor of DNA gyrase (YacG/DUF329 family) [Gordonia humi]